jgi:hypothetical protein
MQNQAGIVKKINGHAAHTLVINNEISKKIKVSFAGCFSNDRKLFSQSKCIMPISMAQKVQEGEKLLATIKLVNIHFKECTFLLGDSLRRITMKIMFPSLSNKESYDKSLELGELWIVNNKIFYEQLSIPYNIIRWDYWLNHPEFKVKYDMVNNLYHTDKYYQNSMKQSASEFLNRYLNQSNLKSLDYDHAFSLCLDYLKEECAIMCLWTEGQYGFEIYPSGRCSAMTATYEMLIQPFYPSLLKPVKIRFKK